MVGLPKRGNQMGLGPLTREYRLALIENKALIRIQIDVFTPSVMHHRPH